MTQFDPILDKYIYPLRNIRSMSKSKTTNFQTLNVNQDSQGLENQARKLVDYFDQRLVEYVIVFSNSKTISLKFRSKKTMIAKFEMDKIESYGWEIKTIGEGVKKGLHLDLQWIQD